MNSILITFHKIRRGMCTRSENSIFWHITPFSGSEKSSNYFKKQQRFRIEW